jgi:hypothetical protein
MIFMRVIKLMMVIVATEDFVLLKEIVSGSGSKLSSSSDSN